MNLANRLDELAREKAKLAAEEVFEDDFQQIDWPVRRSKISSSRVGSHRPSHIPREVEQEEEIEENEVDDDMDVDDDDQQISRKRGGVSLFAFFSGCSKCKNKNKKNIIIIIIIKKKTAQVICILLKGAPTFQNFCERHLFD